MKMSGAQILLECLLEQNVDTIFGYPGGTILNVYDALYGYSDRIRHILTSHEQGAAHAADGYARSTGKVGVCFATSGPGATNLITGIATAYMDSSPVVFISCNVAQNLIGKDAFQEVDFTGIAMPITKFTYLVRYVEQLVDSEQTAALGMLLKYAVEKMIDGKKTIPEIVSYLQKQLETKGLSFFADGGYIPCGYAIPRVQEIYACFNRYRRS